MMMMMELSTIAMDPGQPVINFLKSIFPL